MKASKFVKDMSHDFRGHASLYELSLPIVYYTWSEDGRDKKCTTKYVIVSATIAPFSGAETYIFPADSKGTILDWGELPGSLRGELNHEAALTRMGFPLGEFPSEEEKQPHIREVEFDG